jgi:hypothetical protein
MPRSRWLPDEEYLPKPREREGEAKKEEEMWLQVLSVYKGLIKFYPYYKKKKYDSFKKVFDNDKKELKLFLKDRLCNRTAYPIDARYRVKFFELCKRVYMDYLGGKLCAIRQSGIGRFTSIFSRGVIAKPLKF